MAANKEIHIVYGNQMVKADLPGRSKILRPAALFYPALFRILYC